MNRVIFADIVDDGNNAFGWFESIWNEMVDDFLPINGNLNHITPFSDFLKVKLFKMMKQYREFLVLYDIDTCRDIILNEMEEFLPELINEAITQGLMTNEYWTNFTSMGDITNKSNNKVNYTGFGLTNQQGQFSSSENQATSSGSLARLQHISFLQTYSTRKCREFISSLKSKIFQLIY